MDFVKLYTNWLYDTITQNEISDNLYEITTPFLDRHNDYTQIYIDYSNNKEIIVSDYGYTVDDLKMSGFEFSSEKRKTLLKQVLNKYAVSIDKNGVIFTKVTNINDLADAKHRILGAMIYVNDMFNLNPSVTKSLFIEDVKSFFDANDIYYMDNVTIMGKSKFHHNFDYALQRNKNNPERFIKLMNNPNRKDSYGNIMFSWSDSFPNRKKDSKLIVLLNDFNKVSNEVIEGFENYKNENIKAVLWSNRNEEIKLFA